MTGVSDPRAGTGMLFSPAITGFSKSNPAVETALATYGYAEVLVIVHGDPTPPPAAAALGAATAVGGRTRKRAAAPLASAALTVDDPDWMKYFVVPPASQDASLAAAHVHSEARKASRAPAASAAATATAIKRVAAAVDTEVPKARVYHHLGVVLGTVDHGGLAGLQADPRVAEVHPAPQISLVRPTESATARARAGVTWGPQQLGADALWNAGFTGRGILIGHLDTGVDGTHPALAGAIAHFAQFDDLGKEVPGAQPHDSAEHGTHTAGTLVGRAVRTTQFGMAPGAQLASAMVIEGGNVVARVLGGMNWAVGLGIRVLSMSLGLRGYTPAFLGITQVLRRRGVLPVFAVGNEGPGTSRSPGNYAEALSVGACAEDGSVPDFSSSQTFNRPNDPLVPDLVGPGVDVLSSTPGNTYAEMSGSSMATPHVAGLAALLLQAAPNASIDDVERAIFASCALGPGMQADRANRGLPNGPRALALLTGAPIPAGHGAVAKPPAAKPAKHARPVKSKSGSGLHGAAGRTGRGPARKTHRLKGKATSKKTGRR